MTCDNCGCRNAEYKVYQNGNVFKPNVALEFPLYVISCYDCLPGYETKTSVTVQIFYGAKKLSKVSK